MMCSHADSEDTTKAPWNHPANSLSSHVVVKSGVVYYKPARTLFKGIHRYWCSLHRETDLYPQQLVLYEPSRNHDTNYGKILQTIPLDNVFKVETTDEKGQFDIVTSKKKYSVRTSSLQEATGWVEAINQELFGPPLPGVIYHYRVKAMRNNGLVADYILKVYEDKMKLFTSNGMLSTSFSCNLKEIYKIKYTSSKHHHKSMSAYLSITIKNAKSNYQEQEILVMQAKSPMHLSRVISHRQRLLSEHKRLTTASTPMDIQQKSSSRQTATCASPLLDKIHARKTPLRPNTSDLESCSSFANSSKVDMGTNLLPPPRQLMHNRVAKFLSVNEAITNQQQAMIDMSRSLQDITDCKQLPHPNFSYSNPSLNVFPVYKIHPMQLQVPLTTNAAMTKSSHDVRVKPINFKSTSVQDTPSAEIYDDAYNGASPKHLTIPKEFHFSAGECNDDDHAYVIEYITRYLELLPIDHGHSYESIDDDKYNNHNYDYITT